MPLTKLGIRGLRAFEDKRGGYCPRPNRGPNHEAKPWQAATGDSAAAAAATAPAQHGRKPDEPDLLVVVQQVRVNQQLCHLL